MTYIPGNPDRDDQISSLTKTNDDLENYFRNTIIPQLFVDAGLILRKFTPPAMKQFNLKTSHIGTSIKDIHDNFRFPNIIENIEWVISNNKILEKEVQTTDTRWYQMNILPYIARQTNKADGVIITFIEITARIKDLKELEKLLSDHESLVDTITHDIKNPLSSMMASIELIKKTPRSDKKQFEKLLGIFENAIHTMSDIIKDITDERRKSFDLKSEAELVNIENILEDVILSLTDNILISKAKITTHIKSSEVIFSRRKLRSIIYNLVSNSIKYRSPDRIPRIKITAQREDKFLVIIVSDNGIGIPESLRDKVFTKYYREENTDVEGSGVGLYLVREIITSNGGKIELNTEEGKGSEFRVYLRLA